MCNHKSGLDMRDKCGKGIMTDGCVHLDCKLGPFRVKARMHRQLESLTDNSFYHITKGVSGWILGRRRPLHSAFLVIRTTTWQSTTILQHKSSWDADSVLEAHARAVSWSYPYTYRHPPDGSGAAKEADVANKAQLFSLSCLPFTSSMEANVNAGESSESCCISAIIMCRNNRQIQATLPADLKTRCGISDG